MLSLKSLCDMYTLIFIGVSFLIWHLSTFTFNYWEKQKVPFKKPVPVFGNLTRVFLLFDCIHEFVDDMYYHFRDDPFFGIFQMLEPVMVLRDPKLVYNILVKDFTNFDSRGVKMGYPHKQLNPLSCHVVGASGNRWQMLRKKLTTVFTSSKLRRMQDRVISGFGNVEKFLDERMQDGCTNQDVKNVCDMFFFYVLASNSFGSDFKSLEETEEYRTNANLAWKITVPRIVTSLLDLNYRLKLKLTDYPKQVVDFFMGIVLNRMRYRRKNGVTRSDILQQLMEVQNYCIDPKYSGAESPVPDSERFDEIDVVANSFVFFMAGHETSSLTLSFCIYELALNPDIQDELRAEVEEVYHRDNQTLTADALRDMKYLNAVLSETLRKYPPAPILPRICTSDYQIPNSDVVIKAGTRIMIPIWSLQHDEKYFQNPDKFDPKRFLNANKINIPKGVYLPFGEGPRFCLGKSFTKMQLRTAIANLVLKYQFAPCSKTEIPIVYQKAHVLLNVKNGVWVSIKKRRT